MTNSSIRIAKQLVKVARMLVAFNRSQLEAELSRKRSDLNEASLKEYLDCLEDMDAKEQKAALYWINKKRLILPEDLSKFNEAMNLINKQHLDFQDFEGPMEVINRNDKSTLRIKSQDIDFSPSSEKAFSNPYNAGDGVVIYKVKNSKEGQLAVRKAIDANWGYNKNPWCLAARIGSNTDDELKNAWTYWNDYNAYPKRIAFKNGKLLAFSAGDKKNHVEWWDRNNKSHYTIPESNVMDDIEFLKKHGKYNLVDIKNVSPEILEELAENKDSYVRSAVARNPNTPPEALKKLAEDENEYIRGRIAENPSTPAEAFMKLAEDEDWSVKGAVAMNPNTPSEILMKLAEDENEIVTSNVAKNPNTPAEALMKLAEDEDKWMRYDVAKNPSIPAEILKKLAEDEDVVVRHKVAENPRTPAEILRKLAKDENGDVRNVARRRLEQ